LDFREYEKLVRETGAITDRYESSAERQRRQLGELGPGKNSEAISTGSKVKGEEIPDKEDLETHF